MTRFKNENFEKLTTPKNFFCTFHTEYAYSLALKLNAFVWFKDYDLDPISVT